MSVAATVPAPLVYPVSTLPMTALFATVAVSPLVVTSPVRFGFVTVPAVVAVAALPVIEPAIGAVTVSAASVPTDVRLEVTTLAASSEPVSSSALGTAGIAAAAQIKLTPPVERYCPDFPA